MTAFGALGSSLVELQRCGFFQWFNLEAAEMNGALTVFRPSGPTFRNDVALEAWNGFGGALTVLRLCLSRAFIDGTQWRAFASDIVASFFRDVLGESALSVALEEEAPVLLSPDEECLVQVYRGAKQSARTAYGTLMLSGENDTRNGVPVVIFSVAAR